MRRWRRCHWSVPGTHHAGLEQAELADRPVAGQLDGLVSQDHGTRRPSRTVQDLFGAVPTLTSGVRRQVSQWAPAARQAAKADG